MMARLMAIVGVLLAATSLSCRGPEPMDIAKAEAIVHGKLSAVAPTLGVDISRLPPPVVERQDGKLIYDFKDRAQNVWIVVIVHSNGFGEVSVDKINEKK